MKTRASTAADRARQTAAEALRLKRVDALAATHRKHAKEQAAAVPWTHHPLAIEPGILSRVLELLGPSAQDRAAASTVCKDWRAACAGLRTPVFRFGRLPPLVDNGGYARVSAWTLAVDGTLAAAAFEDSDDACAVRVVRTATGGEACAVRCEGGVRDVALSRDNAALAVLFQHGRTAVVYSVANGAPVATLHGGFDATSALDFSASSLAITAPAEKSIRVFGFPGFAPEPPIALPEGFELDEWLLLGRFSPDGSRLAANAAACVVIFDASTRTPVVTIKHGCLEGGVGDVNWSPDSRLLVAVPSVDVVTRVAAVAFLASTGAPAFMVRLSHACIHFSCSWGAPGLLATATEGGPVRLWSDHGLGTPTPTEFGSMAPARLVAVLRADGGGECMGAGLACCGAMALCVPDVYGLGHSAGRVVDVGAAIAGHDDVAEAARDDEDGEGGEESSGGEGGEGGGGGGGGESDGGGA